MRTVVIAAAVLLLTACGGGDGTAISITGNDGSAVSARADKDGAIKIDTPAFKGEFKLPKIKLDAGDFELNGVQLPPGSKITSIDVDGNGKNDGAVRVNFTSPIKASEVREWFDRRLPDAGFKVTANGNRLSGTTDEGKPFQLATTDAGSDGATGTIMVN